MVDYREHEDVGRVFGLGIDTSAEGWIGHAIQFWERLIQNDNSPRVIRDNFIMAIFVSFSQVAGGQYHRR